MTNNTIVILLIIQHNFIVSHRYNKRRRIFSIKCLNVNEIGKIQQHTARIKYIPLYEFRELLICVLYSLLQVFYQSFFFFFINTYSVVECLKKKKKIRFSVLLRLSFIFFLRVPANPINDHTVLLQLCNHYAQLIR